MLVSVTVPPGVVSLASSAVTVWAAGATIEASADHSPTRTAAKRGCTSTTKSSPSHSPPNPQKRTAAPTSMAAMASAPRIAATTPPAACFHPASHAADATATDHPIAVVTKPSARNESSAPKRAT